MLHIRTYVAPSQIEGLGLFTAEPISKGTVIWRPDPTFDMLIPIADYLTSPRYLKELLDRYAYPSSDRPGFLVYEIDNGRFMNHSAKPNTDFSQVGHGTAIIDIAQGEELTCDYGQFFGEAIEAFEVEENR